MMGSDCAILVVEDEKKVAGALKVQLGAEHCEVSVATSGEEGFFLVNEQLCGLVVLDLMLPGRSGTEILLTIRKRALQTPLLIVTACDAVDDRVVGSDGGADD